VAGLARDGTDAIVRTAWPCRNAIAAGLTALVVCACGAIPQAADPASDAPEGRVVDASPVLDAPSYGEALRLWQSAEDLNAWIGHRFEYDPSRAIALSETQRLRTGRVAIYPPEAFFRHPTGVCVDLSRFAVETLRRIDPDAKPAYLMIEFSPVSIAGNTLRLHWMVTFERDGRRYFFADSKRPGHLAGPYASTAEFIREYAAYRGREIVVFREVESYEKRARARAARQERRELP